MIKAGRFLLLNTSEMWPRKGAYLLPVRTFVCLFVCLMCHLTPYRLAEPGTSSNTPLDSSFSKANTSWLMTVRPSSLIPQRFSILVKRGTGCSETIPAIRSSSHPHAVHFILSRPPLKEAPSRPCARYPAQTRPRHRPQIRKLVGNSSRVCIGTTS